MLVIFMLNRNNCKIGYIRYNDRKYERFKDKIANIFRRIFIKVIIENIVTDFYNNFVKVSGFGSVSKDNIK